MKAIRQREDHIQLALADKSDESKGSITLFVSRPDLQLTQWIIVDAAGEITDVRLRDVNYSAKLKNSQFFIADQKQDDFFE